MLQDNSTQNEADILIFLQNKRKAEKEKPHLKFLQKEDKFLN